jgi:hypothetical protein
MTALDQAMQDVLSERDRQDTKWGVQFHADVIRALKMEGGRE